MDKAAGLKGRLYHLDWLRVIAMFAVFLLHSMHIFDTASEWYIKNSQRYFAATAAMGFLHFWLMPLFFLISGAGSRLFLERRGAGPYIPGRILRLFIPLIAGFLILNPVQEYFQALHRGLYEGSLIMYFQVYFTSFKFFLHPDFFFEAGGHLWFLGFLLLYSMVSLPFFIVVRRLSCKMKKRNVMEGGNRLRGTLFLFLVPLIAVQAGLRPFFPGYGNWADFIFWWIFFLAGFFLYGREGRLEFVRRRCWSFLFGGIAGYAVILIMNAVSSVEPCFFASGFSLQCLGFNSISAVVALMLVLFFLGLGIRCLERPAKFLEYANPAVLPFYILHQPVIVGTAYFVVQYSISAIFKMFLIMAYAFLITLLLYEMIIRKNVVLRLLYGMK